MAAHRITLGDVLLVPHGEWGFQVLAGESVGRRVVPGGDMLRVRTALHNQADPPSHQSGLAQAARAAGCPPSLRAFDRIQLETPTGPFGSASYHLGRDFICVWYCYRPAGLILGAYACLWDLHRDRDHRHAIAECESMMLSAVFNRPAWGASDPLTQALTGPAEPEPRPDPGFDPDLHPDGPTS